jgi:predicted DNA-binding transcriptional regulator AlpA
VVQLLNKKETAALLGISQFSMNRIMAELPHVVVGKRRVLFDPKDVEAYIEARKVKPRRGNNPG